MKKKAAPFHLAFSARALETRRDRPASLFFFCKPRNEPTRVFCVKCAPKHTHERSQSRLCDLFFSKGLFINRKRTSMPRAGKLRTARDIFKAHSQQRRTYEQFDTSMKMKTTQFWRTFGVSVALIGSCEKIPSAFDSKRKFTQRYHSLLSEMTREIKGWKLIKEQQLRGETSVVLLISITSL